MKFIISGKNIDVTEALKEKVQEKVSRLEKFFQEDTKVTATMSVQKNDQTIEVLIPHHKTIYKAVETHPDMYTSIDKVVDMLERQIIKDKTKNAKRIHELKTKSSVAILHEDTHEVDSVNNVEDRQVIRVNKFAKKPMSIDEAVMQLDRIHEDFFMFRNASTGDVNVLYKRNDGHYGLIEPNE